MCEFDQPARKLELAETGAKQEGAVAGDVGVLQRRHQQGDALAAPGCTAVEQRFVSEKKEGFLAGGWSEGTVAQAQRADQGKEQLEFSGSRRFAPRTPKRRTRVSEIWLPSLDVTVGELAKQLGEPWPERSSGYG